MFLLFLLSCQNPNNPKSVENSDSGDMIDTSTTTSEPQDDAIAQVNPNDLPATLEPCRAPILAEVTYVVDGDTIKVYTNQEETVRIIGIDTPEIGYDGEPDDCYAQTAKDMAIQHLKDKRVWLTFDAECSDFYGRTLAYVHTGLGAQGFFERVMLQGGYAKSFPFSGTSTFSDLFAEDEAQAQDNQIGGWGACGW